MKRLYIKIILIRNDFFIVTNQSAKTLAVDDGSIMEPGKEIVLGRNAESKISKAKLKMICFFKKTLFY